MEISNRGTKKTVDIFSWIFLEYWEKKNEQMEELIRTRLDHIDVPSLASNRNTVTMCPTGHMAVIQCNAESFVRI